MRESLSVSNDGSDEARISPTRTNRNAELPEIAKKERGVAYSHSVRGACQQRLVQFIPVRKISLAGAVAASAALPLLLIVLHYLVFVSGTLDWSGHPMSALLNANSPRSLAAWMSSHLWLLCLGTTVLTFQLRRHKLDDYDGEYRLWFWLVFTCLIGSIDSTTRLTELFGAALDRWSQLHVGWSGVAIVNATLATLVGMLGLRLCSELKAVPTSLVLWLVGLLCWAGSGALSQSILHLEMSSAARGWLRASLWLSGLTAIWLCSLYYLRATFMDAQKRFLSRAMASSPSIPWRERLRDAMPKLPRFRREKGDSDLEEAEQTSTKRKKRVRPTPDSAEDQDQEDRQQSSQRRDTLRPAATTSSTSSNSPSPNNAREERETSSQNAPAKRGWGFGLGKLALRPPAQASAQAKAPNAQTNSQPSSQASSASVAPRSQAAQDDEVEREYGKKSGWFGRRKDAAAKDDQANDQKQTRSNRSRTDNKDKEADHKESATNKRSLRDRFSWKRKELTEEQQAERDAKQAARQKARADKAQSKKSEPNAEAGSKKRGWLPKIPKPKLPKLKLPSFRLPPPNENSAQPSTNNRNQVPNVDPSRPLPGTSGSRPSTPDHDQDDNNRNMSKSERKRLKRMQREDDGDRRAA